MCKSLMKMFGSGRTERIAQIKAAEQQEKADKLMREAMTPVEDSDAARAASDAALKRLLGRRGARSALAAGGRGDLAPPSIGLKVLMGA